MLLLSKRIFLLPIMARHGVFAFRLPSLQRCFTRATSPRMMSAFTDSSSVCDNTLTNLFMTTKNSETEIVKCILNNALFNLIKPNEIFEVLAHDSDNNNTEDSYTKIKLSCKMNTGENINIEMKRVNTNNEYPTMCIFKLIATEVESTDAIPKTITSDTYVACIGREKIEATKQKELASWQIQDPSFKFVDEAVTPTAQDIWISIQNNELIYTIFEFTHFKKFLNKVSSFKRFHMSNTSKQWTKLNLLLHSEENQETDDMLEIMKLGCELTVDVWARLHKAILDVVDADLKEKYDDIVNDFSKSTTVYPNTFFSNISEKFGNLIGMIFSLVALGAGANDSNERLGLRTMTLREGNTISTTFIKSLKLDMINSLIATLTDDGDNVGQRIFSLYNDPQNKVDPSLEKLDLLIRIAANIHGGISKGLIQSFNKYMSDTSNRSLSMTKNGTEDAASDIASFLARLIVIKYNFDLDIDLVKDFRIRQDLAAKIENLSLYGEQEIMDILCSKAE